MGGVSRSNPRGNGRGVGPAGKGGSPAQVPKKHPRPEETAAREAEWSQDQTRRYIEDSGSPKSVHNMTPLRGWLGVTHRSRPIAVERPPQPLPSAALSGGHRVPPIVRGEPPDLSSILVSPSEALF